VKASVKYHVIYRHKEKYSISEMCRFFKVSRSGYYDFVNRLDIPAKDLPLAELIRECQLETKQAYGYRRVNIWLERHGVHRNPKTVLRVMRKYNLLSAIRRRKYRNYSQALHKYPNLLNRDFHAERPNQKWVTDISYIHTSQGVLYLSVIRDLYDNSIVSYKTGTTQNVDLALSTIREAKKKEMVTGELQFHSDQGFQYTSNQYFNLTKDYHIICRSYAVFRV
jgi:transposase InsO family protein